MVDRVIQLQPLVRRFGVPALVGMILLALFLDVVLRPEPIGVDFHTYAAASLVGMQTGWAYIYDQNLVTYIQTQIPTRVWTQPFLSPPPVAWMVAPLMALPYAAAFFVWALGILAAFIAALWWSTDYRGRARVIAVAATVAVWWVFSAVHVGQVAPLIAAGLLVAWRLLREDKDFAAEVWSITAKRGVDLILDMVGGDYIERNLRSLKLEGRLVLIAFLQGSKVTVDWRHIMMKRLTVTGSTMRASPSARKAEIARALREKVWPLFGQGKLKSVVTHVFQLEEAPAAHALMESSQHIGKIMLKVTAE